MEQLRNWLVENGLALYGAVTGTVALAISFFSHRYTVKKDSISLLVTYSPHPDQENNVKGLVETEGNIYGDGPHLVPVYVVTVRNVGNIPAPLEDVGIMTSSGENKRALVAVPRSNFSMLETVSRARLDPVAPKAAISLDIYLKRNEPMYSAEGAYAVDQTGKRWESRA